MCEICGKKPVFTKKAARLRMYVSGHSNRKVKPNLQAVSIVEKGAQKRVMACTRCIRTMRKGNLPRQ